MSADAAVEGFALGCYVASSLLVVAFLFVVAAFAATAPRDDDDK